MSALHTKVDMRPAFLFATACSNKFREQLFHVAGQIEQTERAASLVNFMTEISDYITC